MRPHKMTIDRGYQPDMTVSLYVKRDNTTSGRGLWRLAWWDGQSDSFIHAEGECSARYFTTRHAAINYGARTYGELAKWWRQ